MEALVTFVVVVYAVRYGVVDVAYAVRGRPSPRHQFAVRKHEARTARAQPSRPARRAARDYFALLWADAFDAAAARHHAKRNAHRQARPRGRVGRAMLDRWDQTFATARRRQAARPQPSTDSPGRRAKPSVPPTRPATTPPPTDDQPAADAPGPDRQATTAGRGLRLVPPPMTRTEPSYRHRPTSAPAPTPTSPPAPVSSSTSAINGRKHTMTITGEATGLRSAIAYAEAIANECGAADDQIELLSVSLADGGTGKETIANFTAAREPLMLAAGQLREAAAELAKQLAVTEAFEATGNQAGEKAFVTGD